ncbi:MAG: hypothetical protein HY343_09775, partial [Lentisphaerae bacterium]|nr:hypothetical protein [Lentisphaerota bacterium]
AALALGIPARNVCSTNGLGGTGGHFMSEVWMERWQKWCVVDPTFDLVFVKDGVPLGIGELYEHRSEVPTIGLRGTGYPSLPQELKAFLDAFVAPCMEGTKYWAVWPRNDYQSHPEMNPPGHGSTSYAETEWQWLRPSDDEDLGMFPQLVKAKTLMAPPPVPWR